MDGSKDRMVSVHSFIVHSASQCDLKAYPVSYRIVNESMGCRPVGRWKLNFVV